ncbi:MAG: UDP-N-acetylmuramoyl-L-alanine--D-glutamate ligase [Planctomycetes bacterium]|nr:UDP-N-acetylmuramoyl-L-alanine--D-glutamate ligase [Planctomycetota bacterium]
MSGVIPFDRDGRPDFGGRAVTVMGLGLFQGGTTVARFLARHGARVTATDLRSEAELAPALEELRGQNVRYVLGRHELRDFTDTTLVVANPAVAPTNAYLAAARAHGVQLASEAAMFLELCPARIAAVTGTQGKSSTCNTLAQLLNSSGIPCILGGNIGRSLLEAATEMKPSDVVVLELSSYQLEVLPARLVGRDGPPRVEVACVVNVLADHLERHGTVEAYAAAKRRILELPAAVGGRAVLSAEDPRIAAWSTDGIGRVDVFATRASDQGLNIRAGRYRLHREVLGQVADTQLAGAFQRANTLVALGIARLLGAPLERLRTALPGVTALPHRLENLGLHQGVRVFDNGVSTTPDSTLAVFEALAPGFTLMIGGKQKDHLPLADLIEQSRGRVRRVVTFGSAAGAFADAYRAAGFEAHVAGTVPEAVAVAFQHLRPGETLLFSPAAASFDQFLNFQERAQAFRRALTACSTPVSPPV